MSEPVALFLKINGAPVQGESEQTSLGRAQSIECVYYHQAVETPTQGSSGRPTARRQYGPLLIRKRIDRASPLIAKALVQNSVVDAVFKFFRTQQDGTLEQYYTTEIRQARIAGFSQYVPDVLEPVTAAEPPLEEVTFVFQSIEWTHSAGVTYLDSWLHGSNGAGSPAGGSAAPGTGAAPASGAGPTSAFSPDQVLRPVVAGPPSRVDRIVPLTADDRTLRLTRRDLPRAVEGGAPDRVDVGFAPPYVPVGPVYGEAQPE